ncbi:hypothetical protein SAMD00019534_014460 [Acytostelium subglobosum LB1]|uniref:hypothetical protein n=1 Tax=Acytostelium subglobosum LB1 TaxID=1410327 RepID=UPI000644AD5C|nr:hypothetical protein SAMD00019534_014460 [Acytostelium subglobosum LB1]GAM18271.1 hypothetical protein SAMD00019534_014460 [Acytostelium subglobosum LB1]|eukprot:XP_012758867.1 hypothetical protein SAMD00019534_014460 [Acytostelium subglobosum LB1]
MFTFVSTEMFTEISFRKNTIIPIKPTPLQPLQPPTLQSPTLPQAFMMALMVVQLPFVPHTFHKRSYINNDADADYGHLINPHCVIKSPRNLVISGHFFDWLCDRHRSSGDEQLLQLFGRITKLTVQGPMDVNNLVMLPSLTSLRFQQDFEDNMIYFRHPIPNTILQSLKKLQYDRCTRDAVANLPDGIHLSIHWSIEDDDEQCLNPNISCYHVAVLENPYVMHSNLVTSLYLGEASIEPVDPFLEMPRLHRLVVELDNRVTVDQVVALIKVCHRIDSIKIVAWVIEKGVAFVEGILKQTTLDSITLQLPITPQDTLAFYMHKITTSPQLQVLRIRRARDKQPRFVGDNNQHYKFLLRFKHHTNALEEPQHFSDVRLSNFTHSQSL